MVRSGIGQRLVECLNRTNVGLKSSLPPPIVVPLNCLNRTNVGLKCG